MQKPIKICYILPEYSEKTDSHFFHIYELLEELSEKLDIFLVIEKSEIKDIKIGKKSYVQKFKFEPLRFLENFFILLKARILGYKIFYTHYGYIGAVNAAIISKLFGGKSYYWNCAMNWLFKQRKFAGTGYRLSLKWSNFLITGSETMKQGYVEHYGLSPEKIKVMPNWINLDRFQNSQPKADPPQAEKIKNILFVHWLSKRKGADMIVPVVRLLKEVLGRNNKSISFKLSVIGEGPYKEKLLEEIKNNHLGKFIQVLGSIPNKEIIKYYDQADVFFMPSMEEGFPRVLLEAMAMGVPYVASDVGSVREISSETAQRFLVKAGDAEMFAHKLAALIFDKEIYRKFRKEELENVKKYDLKNVAKIFINTISG